MEQMQLWLKKEREYAYSRLRYSVAVIDGLFFFYLALHEEYTLGQWLLLAGCLLAVIGEMELEKRRKLFSRIGPVMIYIVPAFLWWRINGWLALLHLLLLVIDRVATRPLVVTIGKEGIAYPSFPEKKIRWNELENVVLKDGVLTIDFKNNKLLQADIDAAQTPVDEAAFSLYCRQQLKLA